MQVLSLIVQSSFLEVNLMEATSPPSITPAKGLNPFPIHIIGRKHDIRIKTKTYLRKELKRHQLDYQQLQQYEDQILGRRQLANSIDANLRRLFATLLLSNNP